MNEDVSHGGDARGAGGRSPRHTLLTLLIVAIEIVALVVFMRIRPLPPSAAARLTAPSVPVHRIDRRDVSQAMRGRGTVAPKVEVDIVPEVSGRVIFVHEELKAGGVIRAGEKIVQIDPRDGEIAVREAQAAVAEAQARLEMQTIQADIMRRDGRRLGPEAEPNLPAVLREPPRKLAQATLASAQARLGAAQLQLERATVSLPFDVLVVTGKVGLGQHARAGQPLARAYSVEAFEVEVLLTSDELAALGSVKDVLPSSGDACRTGRIPVEVKATFAGREYIWQGYCTRTTGQVDLVSQRVAVVVEIPRPLDMVAGKPPLLPGTSVEVLIPKLMRDD